MTPNDIALEDAKSVLEFNLVNNVGDAAVDKPHDNMNEANSTVIDLKDAAEIETQNPAVSGQIPRVTTSTEGEFDEHHQQSLRAMALRKEVLDKKHGRPNQPAVTVAGPLQPIKNGLVENKAAIDAVNGSNNLDPISKASASQQEHQSVSTCKKILDLKSTVDKIIETSKASQGANIIAFPELVKPELGTRAAINTAGYPELIETEVGKEVGTAAATNNAGPVGTEVGTAAAMNTTGYTDNTAYPAALWTNPPGSRKPGNRRPRNLKAAASKPGMAKKPIANASNSAVQSMGPPEGTGGNDSTSYPSILGKRILPSQKGEPSKPTKKRSTVKFALPAPPSKKGAAKSGAKAPSAQAQKRPATRGAAVSPAKSKDKSATPNRPAPPAFPLSIPAHLVNPPGQPSYASIIAAAPLDRPAIFLGDDLARARGLDPLAPLANPDLERFARSPHLMYPHAAEKPVPQTWSQAEEPDRMLYLLHQAGADWETMTKEWYKITGTWHVGDVLPQRLAKFRENMTVLSEGDAQLLLNAAHDVEADYRSSKWEMIADRLVEYGGGEYTTTFLQRKHKELEFEQQLEKGWGP